MTYNVSSGTLSLYTTTTTTMMCYCEFIHFMRVMQCTDRSGEEKELTSKFFIIATGGRPRYPQVPGAKEFAISRSV